MEAPLDQRLCTASSLQWNSLTRMTTGLNIVLTFIHTIVVHFLLFLKFFFNFLPVFRIRLRIKAGSVDQDPVPDLRILIQGKMTSKKINKVKEPYV